MAQSKRGKIASTLTYKKTYTVDYDAVEKDRIEADRIGGGGVPWWKPKEGDNTIRILPPHKDSDKPYHRLFLHYGIGQFPILCLGKDSCPICKYLETQERGHDLRGVLRIYFNIIDRKDPNHKVQVYSAGNTVFKEFIEVFLDDDWGDVVDPVEGTDMIIRRAGSGLNTEYSVRFKRNPSPIATTQEEFDGILEKIFDLGTLSEEFTADQIETMLEGWVEENEDEGDDNYARLKKADKVKKKVKSKKKKETEEKVDEEEDDDEAEEEIDEDDEDDVDDDDDGEEDEEEEEEEEEEEDGEEEDDEDDDGDTPDPDADGDDGEDNDEEEGEDDDDDSDPVDDALDDLLGDDRDDDDEEAEKPPPKKKRTRSRKK